MGGWIGPGLGLKVQKKKCPRLASNQPAAKSSSEPTLCNYDSYMSSASSPTLTAYTHAYFDHHSRSVWTHTADLFLKSLYEYLPA